MNFRSKSRSQSRLKVPFDTLREGGLVYSKMLFPELISVVITTYNRSDALSLVLAGLARQTDQQFEVVIADDGSQPEHVVAIAAAAEAMQFPVTHVWHPDVGFTAAQVRNLGVAAARGAYLVLLDGDCVPEVDFIARHRQLQETGYFINGSRVLLSRPFTDGLLCGGEMPVGRTFGYWLTRRWAGDASKLTGALRLPDLGLRRQTTFVWKGIRSCNMAVWRVDYEAVNGFDETFVGWGHEDADFVLRLHNAGLVRKNGFCATEVYHLWHPESDRGREGVNADKVRERQKTGQVRATVGYQESLAASNTVIRSWG
ncbi:glycosyltransferase family 2 protein [Rhodoferax saidenbachensis]|uniref:Glycosyltransferase involved in cell wall biosynthesis n=1 Tax=Rhodoferax saidenbachensis TaxID=1484693 RepID=A0ABU1ZIA7_9BURK|nr:glycosyltransferase family 2 protein [Rhodoferax saidenbachensis]MDR7305267.1 glycosyltransferase involved in cell wall biosynthesis [Rhodoferax saidenbachensis]